MASAIAIGLAAAFVWLGLAVRSGPTTFDTAVIASVHALAGGWTGTVLDAFSAVGKPVIWAAVVIAIALVLAVRGRLRDGVMLGGWLLVAEVAAELAKIFFDRVRPDGVAVSDLITQASYPSGHVLRTVVALGLLAYVGTTSPRARAAAVALAITVSFVMGAARVASGEHWPTDVGGGFLLSGAILAVAVASASGSFQRSRISPRS